jgi:hypothetical protein
MRKTWVGRAVCLVLLVEVGLFSASFSKFFCGDSLYFFSHTVHSAAEVQRIFTSLDDLSSYRPLPTMLFSFVLEPLFGFHPLPYHLLALSVHLLTSFLVFLLLRRVARSDTAAIAGLVFFGTQATGFYLTYDATFLPDFTAGLLTAAAFVSFAYGRRLLSLIPFVLALFCKESAVMIPVGLAVIAILEATDEHRSEVGELRGVLPHAVLAAIFIAFQSYLHRGWLYPSHDSAYRFSFGPSSLLLKFKYLLWVLNLPSDWFRQRWGMIPSIVVMAPPLIWFAMRVWRCRNREAVALVCCAAWALAAVLPAIPVAQVPMKHNLYISLMAVAVIIARCASHVHMRRASWWLAACFVAATAFHVRNDLKLSWVGEGSDVTEASLHAVERADPPPAHGSALFILPTNIPGGISWYFDDESLFRRVYKNPSLHVYYADLHRLPPSGFERSPDVLVFAYDRGRLYDVTADYKRAVLSAQSGSAASSLLPGPAGLLSAAFSRASIEPGMVWPADQLIQGQAAGIMPQSSGDSLRQSLVMLPQTVVRIPVDTPLPPDSELLVGVERACKQESAGQGRLIWESKSQSGVERHDLLHVMLDPGKSEEGGTAGGWWDGARDLSAFAGQSGTLVIENTGGRESDWIAWSRLRIVPKSAHEVAVEAGSQRLPDKTLLADFSDAQISSDVAWAPADLLGGRAAAGLQLLSRGGESREAMVVLPSTSVRFPVSIMAHTLGAEKPIGLVDSGDRLHFAVSTGPDHGCGAEMSVALESAGHSDVLFHLILDDELDSNTWWHIDLNLGRALRQSGTLVFRNDAPRTCQMAAWSDLQLTSATDSTDSTNSNDMARPPEQDAGFRGRPLADRPISLMDLLSSARKDFDRREHYPSYEKFDSPTGQPAFLWCARPARPTRLSLVTMAGARLRYDFASLPAHSYLSLGVAHGTGVGDGVEAHVYWEDAQGREEIYQRMVTPQMRDWEDAIIPLPRRAMSGGTLSIAASSGPKGNTIGDWLAWSRLRIISSQ